LVLVRTRSLGFGLGRYREHSTTRKGVFVIFSELLLSAPILEAIRAEGYTVATPIQAQAIPVILTGKDVLGCAQTGTGKTAAFAAPIIHKLSIAARGMGKTIHRPRCLVLCPTRELATQIASSFHVYGKGSNLRLTTVFGGVGQHPQVQAMRRGVDIIVATPGRLMDLMEQRHVDLSAIEVLVLDEADRMLDMGFIQPIRRIVAKLPATRQTLLFSATMPPEIRGLADSLLRDPAVINVIPKVTSIAKIEESVYRVEKREKAALLAHLVQSLPMYRAIVFTRTKHGADRLVRHLHIRGLRAEAIHGNKSQGARQRALSRFASNKLPILVATDIASRGIDVDGITHVVNYDLTHEPETYVHRIGRTGRAGAAGVAVSFCDRDEVGNLRAIERLTRRPIPSVENPLPAGTADDVKQSTIREEGEDKRSTARKTSHQSHSRHSSFHSSSRHENSRPGHSGSHRGSSGSSFQGRHSNHRGKRSGPSQNHRHR
jgi:ATP-dependent RNA helicase RhlE